MPCVLPSVGEGKGVRGKVGVGSAGNCRARDKECRCQGGLIQGYGTSRV